MEDSVPVMAETSRLDWNIVLVPILVTFVVSLKLNKAGYTAIQSRTVGQELLYKNRSQLVIVNQQELFSRNLIALVWALDWGLKQQELSRNQKILHGGKIWQELSENSRNHEGLG